VLSLIPISRAFTTVIFLSFVVPAEATLLSRLGGAAAYDDVLKITWTTDASLSGLNTWANQVAWADGFSLGGFDDWRLASMSVAAGLPTGTTGSVVACETATELACRDNELGYMFYQNLSGIFDVDLTGDQTVDGVDLTNIQSNYWPGTEFNSSQVWAFNYEHGFQGAGPTEDGLLGYGWAVRSGDVAAVPEPPMVWLLVMGMIGLLGVAGRQRRR